VSAHLRIIGVWLVAASTLAACSFNTDRSALMAAGGQGGSATAGASGTAGDTGGGGTGLTGWDGGRDTMSSTDTAPPPTDANVEKCTPIQCQTAGGNYCGSFPDGCGGIAMCGNDCPMGQTCGTNHLCAADSSCVPIPCSGPGHQFCGTIGDGCNHALSCPDCTAPQTCGGGGTPHVCGM
jgi:hypothetical protein